MTDWFRSWHGAPTDPKWLGIAKRAGVAPGIAVAVAWALMDRASAAPERGSIAGYDADGLACFFGCDPEQVVAIVAAMTEKGMISGDRFTSWERRQPKREDDSSERVRQHRERTKQQAQRNVTQSNAPDTDTDTDKKQIAQHTAPPRVPMLFDKLCDAAGFDPQRVPSQKLLQFGAIRDLLGKGYSLETDVLPVIRDTVAAGVTFSAWSYIVPIVIERAAKRSAIPPKPVPQQENWHDRMKVWNMDQTWAPAWGPKPGEPGCRVPAELLRTAA